MINIKYKSEICNPSASHRYSRHPLQVARIRLGSVYHQLRSPARLTPHCAITRLGAVLPGPEVVFRPVHQKSSANFRKVWPVLQKPQCSVQLKSL
jgi:hypothetical protein